MRRLLKLSLIVAVMLGLAVWWWMPSKVERIPLGNIDPSFQGWCVTDLDGDGDAEILITYPRRTTILMGLQKDNLEFMDLHGFDSVVLPSSENPHSLLLPPAKAVPAKINGQFKLARLKGGQVVLEPFPKVKQIDHVVWVDADKDGKCDDLIARDGNKRFWFKMNEQGEWQFEAPLPSGPKQQLIGVGDLDGDERPEIVLADKNHVVLWGDGKPKANLGTLLQAQLTDMDGDGQKEIAALRKEGSFSRLVIWKYDPTKKQLVSLSSPTFEALVTAVINGQRLPTRRDSLMVSDLDGDGLKEVIVYASMSEWFDLFTASSLVAQLRYQLHFLLSSKTSPSTIHLSPSPSSKSHAVQSLTSAPLWLLFCWDGKRFTGGKLKQPKEMHCPVTLVNMGTQNFLIAEGWKHIRRFQPRLHSLNPLYLTWWEEGIVRQGELWQIRREEKSKPYRFVKVADLPGKTEMIADLNGDKFPEIVWVREIMGTFPQPSTVMMGVMGWKLGKWRKATWVLKQQSPFQQGAYHHTGAVIVVTSPALRILPALRASPARILPIKVVKGFDLLIASPDGTIERVRIR
jgi:hypothetical protein